MCNSICIGELMRPSHGQELNYVHVLFEWDQEPDAIFYQIELEDLNSNQVVMIDSIRTNLFIETTNITWNKIYQWRVRSCTGDGSYGIWIGPSIFIVNNSKLRNANITNYQDSLIQPGLTMMGGPNPGRHTVVVDKNGNEIWNDGDYSFKINHVDEYGALYGNSDHLFPDHTASKVNYAMDFLWSSNQEVDPHDFRETSRNTFFALRNIFSDGPIPSNISMTDEFREMGFFADDSTHEFPWYAQEIIEFDHDNNIIWSWNPFEHYSLDDHDSHGHTWWDAFMNMKYDWTHSNSIFFDEVDSAIYLSSRHLSRISKIDYPSGDIIYDIGLPSPYIASGDSSIGNNLLFNFQHHVQRIENGNFTLFDNGNISNHVFDHGLRISRAIEFEVIGDTACNMIWSHSLPTNLYGRAGGSIQVLDNNNRLIYTRGNSFGGANNPTIIEMTNEQEVVWKLNVPSYYAWYRAFRIPSIHPDAFSIIVSPFSSINTYDNEIKGIVLDASGEFMVSIKNESGYPQPYYYKIKDDRGWIQPLTGTATIAAGGELEFQLDCLSSGQVRKTPYSNLDVIVTPLKHSYAKKHVRHVIFDRSDLVDTGSLQTAMMNGLDNFPNPFNPVTKIHYDLLKNSNVKIVIYDLMGRMVETLFEGFQEAGPRTVQWNTTNGTGQSIGTGLYFYTIEAGSEVRTGKMLLVK